MSDTPLGTVAFAERILALLDEGSFSSTYKFAVLLGLMDLCLEGTTKSGTPPETVTTVQLSQKIIEIYWRQVSRYDDSGRILGQNAGLSAKIPRLISEFRQRHGENLTLFESRTRARVDFEQLLREVEWTLVQMPLPKLQRFGTSEARFVYEIAWDDAIRRSAWSKTSEFDNRIRFVGEAAAHLVRISSLLRPLIQQKWATKIADLNHLEIDRLQSFLFGTDRTALTRVARPLLAVQRGCCFYCQTNLAGTIHVDHFIPWCLHPDDGIDNLVAAHPPCNLAKRNFIAGHEHLERWMERSCDTARGLEELASESCWPRDKLRTQGTVRATYVLAASRRQTLWRLGGEFETADQSRIMHVLALC